MDDHLKVLDPELIPVYRQSATSYLSHPPSSRLLLLSARPVTFPAAEHQRPLASTHFTVPWRVNG